MRFKEDALPTTITESVLNLKISDISFQNFQSGP